MTSGYDIGPFLHKSLFFRKILGHYDKQLGA